jgi:hypothetical protein
VLDREDAEVDSGRSKRLERSARLQLVLPEQSIQRLESLKAETDAATFAEVLRRALRLYSGLITESKRGGRLAIVYDDGSTADVPLHKLL